MKVWVDLTASAHVLVFRPLVRLLRERGAELTRVSTLRRWARGRSFDLALAHGSHDLTLTARTLRIPSATTFDYEFAWLQHQLGCRAATRVVVPDAIPDDRLPRYGPRAPKLPTRPGPTEEYHL